MNLNIDFCIVKNPLDGSDNKLLIFVTKSGLAYLDKSVMEEEGYKLVVDALKEVNYIETGLLQFQYFYSEKIEDSDESKLFLLLENMGANHSQELMENIYRDFDLIENNVDLRLISEMMQNSQVESFESSIEEAFYRLHSEQVEFTDFTTGNVIPEVNEAILLNMYLFFDIIFKPKGNEYNYEDYKANLSSSFSKQISNDASDGEYKTLIKIISDNFVRKHSEKENVLLFESTKTKHDLCKEISFLYEVVIDIIKASKLSENQTILEESGYYFNILDLKAKLGADEKLTFEIPFEKFDEIINNSNKILKERNELQNEDMIDVEEVIEECEEFISSLQEVMINFAQEEQFKEASKIKETIGFMSNKLEIFKTKFVRTEIISIEQFHNLLGFDF